MTEPSRPTTPGRENELGRFAEQLRSEGSSVIVITGELGSGKSYVTSRAVNAAVAAGWRVTPYRNGRGVRVGTGTTAPQLRDEVSRALRLPTSAGADGRRPLAELGDALKRAAAAQPVLVVLDPYLPSEALTRAIQRQLLPALRRPGGKVAVVFVARRHLDKEVRADLELDIERPDTDSVKRSLIAASRALEPAVDDAELAAYVTAARANPRLLASLVTVLPLAVRRPTPVGQPTSGRSV